MCSTERLKLNSAAIRITDMNSSSRSIRFVNIVPSNTGNVSSTKFWPPCSLIMPLGIGISGDVRALWSVFTHLELRSGFWGKERDRWMDAYREREKPQGSLNGVPTSIYLSTWCFNRVVISVFCTICTLPSKSHHLVKFKGTRRCFRFLFCKGMQRKDSIWLWHRKY